MTNVGPNAPHGPLNGSGPNVHVFESSLPVGCSRAVNVHVCHLKNFTTAANTILYPPGQTPPPTPPCQVPFLRIWIFLASSKKKCSSLLLLLWLIPPYLKSHYGGRCVFAVGCHGNELFSPWKGPQVLTITCSGNKSSLLYPSAPPPNKKRVVLLRTRRAFNLFSSEKRVGAALDAA